MKLRKIAALILTLFMLISLSLTSLASERTGVYFTVGDEIAGIAPQIVTLVSSLSCNVLKDKNSAIFALLLNSNQLFEIAHMLTSDGLYIRSSLTGSTTFYISWSWLVATLSDYICGMVNDISREMISAYLQNVVDVISGKKSLIELLSEVNFSGLLPVAAEESADAAAESELSDILINIMSKIVTATGEFSVDNMNTADTKVTLSLTMDEVMALISANTVSSPAGLDYFAGEENSDAGSTDTEAFVSSFGNQLADTVGRIDATLYMADGSTTGAQLAATGVDGSDLLQAVFGILDQEDGRHFHLNVTTAGMQLLKADAALLASGDIDSSLLFSMGEQNHGLTFDKNHTDEGSTVALSYYSGENAKTFDKPIATLHIDTVSTAESVGSILSEENAKDVSTFGESDVNALRSAISTGASGILMNLMQNVPPEILQLFLGFIQ